MTRFTDRYLGRALILAVVASQVEDEEPAVELDKEDPEPRMVDKRTIAGRCRWMNFDINMKTSKQE